MRRLPTFILAFSILAAGALAVRAQDGPPDGPGGEGAGGPPRRGGPGGPGGPGGFHLIPRFAMEKLNLTEDQQKQVADLEKETKTKLYKILTPKQQKTLEASRPPRPGEGQGGPGNGGGRGGAGGRGRGGAGRGGPGAGGPGGGGPDGPGSGGPGGPDNERSGRPPRPAEEQ